MPTGPSELVLRLPRSAYLIVLFVLLGVIPLALVDASDQGEIDPTTHFGSAGLAVGPRLALLVIPVLVAFFIARTATFVDSDGIRVRALFGSRAFSWDEIRGLSVIERAVYAIVSGGSVRLPCARIAHLHAISEASGGRLPEVDEHVPKPAPARRRRRASRLRRMRLGPRR